MSIVFLINPSFLDLDDAFRSLKKFSKIQVKTSNLGETIDWMEKIGFVAIKIVSVSEESYSFILAASKGKHGPCHFSGKHITYTGLALAAIDDDNHVFLNGEPKSVCDKTFDVLQLPDYEQLIDCDQKESDGQNREDDFEQSLENLLKYTIWTKEELEERKNFLYTGPFRFLIMSDGNLVRRGSWTGISAALCKDKLCKEGFRDWGNSKVMTPIFFQDVYPVEGSACLMNLISSKVINQPYSKTDFSKLSFISEKLKKRLIDFIETERKYFVLIGNEVDDKLGCCPSQEVTEANLLVQSGILDSISEEIQGDSCPVTLYAFKNELSTKDVGFCSTIDKDFRTRVFKLLTKSWQRNLQLILKRMLLIFTFVSIVVASRQCILMENETDKKNLGQLLDQTQQSEFQVVLFHNKKRCLQCKRMESFTQEVLQSNFADFIQSGKLKFNTVVIDDPEHSEIIEQYGIFASTLILISTEDMDINETEILQEAPKLYRDEAEFKSYLINEIKQFLIEHDD